MRAEPRASLQWGLFLWQASWVQAQPSSGLGIFKSELSCSFQTVCVCVCVSVCRRHLVFKLCVCLCVWLCLTQAGSPHLASTALPSVTFICMFCFLARFELNTGILV